MDIQYLDKLDNVRELNEKYPVSLVQNEKGTYLLQAINNGGHGTVHVVLQDVLDWLETHGVLPQYNLDAIEL
jgi:hypothetical protein